MPNRCISIAGLSIIIFKSFTLIEIRFFSDNILKKPDLTGMPGIGQGVIQKKVPLTGPFFVDLNLKKWVT